MIQHTGHDLGFLLRPEYFQHTFKSLNLRPFEFGITARHEDCGLGRLSVLFPDYIAAFLVRMFRHRAGVHKVQVGTLGPGYDFESLRIPEQFALVGGSFRIIEFASQR